MLVTRLGLLLQLHYFNVRHVQLHDVALAPENLPYARARSAEIAVHEFLDVRAGLRGELQGEEFFSAIHEIRGSGVKHPLPHRGGSAV